MVLARPGIPWRHYILRWLPWCLDHIIAQLGIPLRTASCSYGERFVVLEKAVGSTQYERLTLKHIRNLTAPGDKVLHRSVGTFVTAMPRARWQLAEQRPCFLQDPRCCFSSHHRICLSRLSGFMAFACASLAQMLTAPEPDGKCGASSQCRSSYG